MKKILPFFLIIVVVLIFFWQFFSKGLFPIPSDTIIGLYHPFRDLYSKNYPNGIPFKNFLITDPVRQQYPWRKLAISLEKKLQLPLWNPYSFSGTPLLANLQSGPFYPLNILFFMLPFNLSWSILIILESLLGMIFLYLYLENLKINKYASFLGSLSFGFSGFFIAWIEWGTIIQVALWLPLILLSIDKIFACFQEKSNIKNQISKIWSLIFIFSLISSFFAGHLQVFSYVFIVSVAYFFSRWLQYGKSIRAFLLFAFCFLLFAIITFVQWLPTLQLILLSARNIDQVGFNNPGWFIPWQHLIQFLVPDFFGNPTTLNYWGAWNYGEFIGYFGTFSLLMAFFALFFRHDKKTLFFGTLFFLSLIFALPTIFAKIPYFFKIPFIDTSQPTRLLFVVDFSLAILASFGFDYFIRYRNKGVLYIIFFTFIVFLGLWLFVFFGKNIFDTTMENILVAKRNLLLPTILFLIFSVLIGLIIFINKQLIKQILYLGLIILTIFELLRFGLKFIPFTNNVYLFPSTRSIEFLQKQIGEFRIMSIDSRILPPNFSVIYGLQSVEGYDPLYTKRYGELIAASERGKPDISPPFGFNRIITPHNYDSRIMDLLGVKYVLSLSDVFSAKLKKVFQEGETRIYENENVLPRVFFVKHLELARNNNEAIEKLFDKNFDLKNSAVVEGIKDFKAINKDWSFGKAEIIEYSENKIIINSENENEGFLVFTDSFYPTWHAQIDSSKIKENEIKIYRTDYNLRGIIVPKGKHAIIFTNSLL